jgi:glycosyltransferase involved in cell wall biosynthesis
MRASRRIVVFHDDDAVRLRRLASLARSRSRKALTAVSAAKYARWQHRVLQETDEAWFSSSADRDRLVHPARIPETRIVPNGASDDLWSVPPVTQGSRPVALFVGPARYEANRAGVSWFVDHVWRSVRERMPTAQFRVVGAGWNGAIAGRGVSFEGWKPSLLGPYGETSVVVAPLSAGGGTKIKVIEAMAAGRPVVTTAVGAEGLPPAAGLSVIDDAAAFARCVIHYLSDAEASRAAGQANRDAVKDLRWSTIWEAAADHLRVQIGAVR